MTARRDKGPNAALIGQPGSREHLETPALILDLDQLELNITAMAEHANAHGYMLRPTVKIHKSSEIARRQVDAGSTVGVCCATLAEAEAMVDGGIPDVLLFTSVVSERKIERLAALSARAPGVVVAVDDESNATTLARAARRAGTELTTLVDYEVGNGRTGVEGEDEAVALARLIDQTDGLAFAGIQGYLGIHQTIVDFEERRQSTLRHGERLVRLVNRLDAAGLPAGIVSVGGTGTHAIEAELGVDVEVQVGSYVFMDLNYLDVEMRPEDPHPFWPALFVRATVVSCAQQGFVVTDVGNKDIDGYKGPTAARVARGASSDSAYSLIGDNLGRIDLAASSDRPQLGSAVELIPPHCWQTVALHSLYHCVRGDTLVDIWPIEAKENWW